MMISLFGHLTFLKKTMDSKKAEHQKDKTDRSNRELEMVGGVEQLRCFFFCFFSFSQAYISGMKGTVVDYRYFFLINVKVIVLINCSLYSLLNILCLVLHTSQTIYPKLSLSCIFFFLVRGFQLAFACSAVFGTFGAIVFLLSCMLLSITIILPCGNRVHSQHSS